MERHLRAKAELVRRLAREVHGTPLDYDEEGVHWLDAHLDQLRGTTPHDLQAELVEALGAFLGECLRRSLGGRWVLDDLAGLALELGPGLVVSPHAKVAAQLRDAQAQSVLAFFISLPAARAMGALAF